MNCRGVGGGGGGGGGGALGHKYATHCNFYRARKPQGSFDAGAKHHVAAHEALVVPVRIETATSLY